MAIDILNTVRQWVSCAKQRIQLRKHASFLKLFPAKRPGEYVAIDILGPQRRTSSGHECMLVMSDQFSKMTLTYPLREITAYAVAQAFCKEWVYRYRLPTYLLSDRSAQFVCTFFNAICGILGVTRAFTSAYHHQNNDQVERFNRTIMASLRAFYTESGRIGIHS